MSPSSEITNKYLLLDSCVVQYLFNKEINAVLSTQLSKWSAEIFELAISDITYAELLNGVTQDKEKRLIELLDQFYGISITQRVVKGCGKLGCIYNEKDNQFKDIEMGDKIIASTSVIHNLPIVTANIKDFPYPFFEPISTENLVYKDKGKSKMICVGVLNPNYQFITYSLNNRK